MKQISLSSIFQCAVKKQVGEIRLGEYLGHVNKNGIFIALAWPETSVIREGKWYDPLMKLIGVIKADHYKVGHAAMLLINQSTGDIRYFDFGRYHTPYQYGRVRDQETDPELTISAKAKFQDATITNLEAILIDLQHNKACHGDGPMICSMYDGIDYDVAFRFAKRMQLKGAIKYGPLEPLGTNCSRFVAAAARHSISHPLVKFLIKFPYTFSATPKFNLRIINNQQRVWVIDRGQVHTHDSSLRNLIGSTYETR
ncbi:MAG: hypothetical protein JXQ90_07735 [Cyclobacteriaceae bacterium]